MIQKNKYSSFICFQQYKSVLCLNGNLPNKDFFEEINIPIIAADGAANILYQKKVMPDIIIGDLDSVYSYLLRNIEYVKISNQNQSDFQKAIKYIKNNRLYPSIICGMNGGYIDHIVNNISIFSNSDNCVFIDTNQSNKTIIGYILNKGIHNFHFTSNTKLSIFGVPICNVTSVGLKWELTNSEMKFFEYNSCFNRTTTNNLLLVIKYGKLLMLVYTDLINDYGSIT